MNRLRIFKFFSSLVLLLSLVFIYPTFQPSSLPSWWNFVFPSNQVSLGLDLRGGIFVALGLDEETSSKVIIDKESKKIKTTILENKILLRSIKS